MYGYSNNECMYKCHKLFLFTTTWKLTLLEVVVFVGVSYPTIPPEKDKIVNVCELQFQHSVKLLKIYLVRRKSN